MARESKHTGFSLLEIMIVLSIVGLLMFVAYPSYVNSIKESYRNDAKEQMALFQIAMEQYYAKVGNYEVDTPVVFTRYYKVKGETIYAFVVHQGTKNKYTLLGIPKGSMEGDRCGTLTYDSVTDRKWGMKNGQKVYDCW